MGKTASPNNYNDAPELLQKFITYVDTVKGKSKRTADAYFSDLQTFLRYIKVINNPNLAPVDFNSPDSSKAISALREISISDVGIDLIQQISPDDLYNFMAYLNRTRGNDARARKRKTASIRMFFKFLYGNLKLLDNNPAELLESPKIGKTLPIHLDLTDAQRLIATVKNSGNQRDFTIITLFLNCGMRLSELVGINITEVREKTIIITGKGNKQRTVYLNKACLDCLSSYMPLRLSVETRDNALFLNKNRTRITGRSVERIVDKYIALSGLDPKYTVHKLRHTAATLMYQHGNVDVRALQEILGHEQLSTTQIYTHIDEKRLQDAVDANPLANI